MVSGPYFYTHQTPCYAPPKFKMCVLYRTQHQYKLYKAPNRRSYHKPRQRLSSFQGLVCKGEQLAAAPDRV